MQERSGIYETMSSSRRSPVRRGAATSPPLAESGAKDLPLKFSIAGQIGRSFVAPTSLRMTIINICEQ